MLARFLILSVLSLFLAGCAGIKIGIPTTSGAFISAPKGKVFEPIDALDPRNAMVYVYRPANQWGYEEVQAPTFFIDSTQIFGLKSGAYSWLELHGGRYEFYARRPMSVLFLKTIFDVPLEVEGGKVYYFRYSEDQPLVLEELVPNPADFVQAGPLQQVPEGVALRELKNIRLDEMGLYYGGEAYEEPRWAPFFTYPDRSPVASK
ncbi:MAG: hypothetical protein CVV10_09090 [Gammaproteobacteria bacterium HGW-Gammaproteobacteria-14]|nr:MAG: hypothetical protein CVV10_09090 [Gammaproteobacteria bacterium HGW-Gammaproteobacteria-14]